MLFHEASMESSKHCDTGLKCSSIVDVLSCSDKAEALSFNDGSCVVQAVVPVYLNGAYLLGGIIQACANKVI
jgi:hypothetical protein